MCRAQGSTTTTRESTTTSAFLLLQAHGTAVGSGPARRGGGLFFLKLGCKILHSGHFWHCFTMVVVVGPRSGPAKAGPTGAAATPLHCTTAVAVRQWKAPH